MAREIVVVRDGRESRFGFERVSREKLYGTRRRVAVDENGEECRLAELTRDGQLLLPGSTAQLYVDQGFDVVERDSLQAVDVTGRRLEAVEATLGIAQELTGPVPAERVLDCETSAVYQLDPAAVDEDLLARLDAGEIFETRFSFRGGYALSPLFLVKNEHGLFGLVADEVGFEPLRRDVAPAASEEDDPFAADDLDFSMF
ncbi:MAG: hypothetical protein KC635_06905 [Myxococcales bacterium]|nr:hypothetical protein [Myxococcales bacterium]MCB9733153.1 hypothetical protein [Deltaproteobacteria bacterium]